MTRFETIVAALVLGSISLAFAGVAAAQMGDLPHTPVPEQLASTAVPVYVEVPPTLEVGHAYVYYKGLGMTDFRRIEMARVGGGYGIEIPCSDIFEPAVEYYIVLFDPTGSPAGFAGTRSSPIRVPIVASRTHPAPTLPGRPAPQTCTEGGEAAGGGTPGASVGANCSIDNDCSTGLRCDDGACLLPRPPFAGGCAACAVGATAMGGGSRGRGLGLSGIGMGVLGLGVLCRARKRGKRGGPLGS